MAFRSSSQANSNGTAASWTKPSAAAADDICILFASTDISGKTCSTPTGFTAITALDHTGPDGHTTFAFWKRLDGSEGSTFTATFSGSASDWECHAACWSGRDTGNPPVFTETTPNTSANSSPVSIALTGVTALAGDDLAWLSALDPVSLGAWSHTPPSGFTEATDHSASWCANSIAYQDNVSAGATGTITGTGTSAGNTAGFAGWVVRIPTGADTTPDAFTFTDQTNVALSTLTESNAITVSGITAAAAISVTGGEYQINGGSWVTSSGTVSNGDSVKVRHTSSASNSTATNTTLTIGGVSDTFTTTTLSGGYTVPPINTQRNRRHTGRFM